MRIETEHTYHPIWKEVHKGNRHFPKGWWYTNQATIQDWIKNNTRNKELRIVAPQEDFKPRLIHRDEFNYNYFSEIWTYENPTEGWGLTIFLGDRWEGKP